MKTIVALVALVMVGAVGCKKKKELPPPPAPVKTRPAPARAVPPPAPVKVSRNVAIVQAGYRAFNDGRLDAAVRDLASQITWINVGTGKRGRLTGKRAVRAFFAATRKAFPDARAAPVRIFDAGKVVVVESSYTGKQAGPWMGAPSKGRRFGLRVAHWFRLQGGKVREVHAYTDAATMREQLGLTARGGVRTKRLVTPPTAAPRIFTGAPQPQNIVRYRALVQLRARSPRLGKYLSAGARLRVGGAGVVFRGIEAFRKANAPMEKAFPDLRRRAVEVHSVGSWVVARLLLTGTQRGKLGKLAPTGKRVRLHAAQVVHLAGGKVDRGISFANRLELPAQLGLLKAGGRGKGRPR